MNTIDSYSAILNMYNQTVNQTPSIQTQYASSTASTTSVAAIQSTDSVSISQQAQEAYQALSQSLVNSLSSDDPSSGTLESILVSSMQVSMQPFLQIISDKANATTTGSAASVSGAASATGAISTDWGSALDSLVAGGAITQGQKTSIETALNAEAQSKVSATSAAGTANAASTLTKNTSNLVNLPSR